MIRRTFRTSRKSRPCIHRIATHCSGTIKPGDPYMESVMSPNSEFGNKTWWRAAVCIECVHISGAQEGITLT